MVGILIVTHGDFAKSILRSAELIMGQQNDVITLGLHYGDSIDELNNQIKDSIEKLDEGQGVVVFVDVFGGSPSNVTVSNMRTKKFECITGVNMPMLLEAFALRNSLNLEELSEKCIEAGQQGVRSLYKELAIKND
ncbi:PTS sugar transporter subunit IIA [Irregularibacter muris]|uniref:PTS sugar transporter subunit IIA n=1 Tax=Irregularibacter muris TaxID=1796619 RepID=A0AAE3L3H7_9FIRM|nr:PTS sugar transporter subunit IIA [Irregularibacter muris]MCR1898278.1 PTS sugar transporter subunit IIA [Irregularibacter muris]